MSDILKNPQIRPLKPKDWPVVLSWFEDHGWLNRHMFFDEIGHCTVYVAVDENDVPISAVTCGTFEKFTYLNHFVTDSKFQGKGLGLQLWQDVVEKQGPEKNFFLKAVPHMAEKYKSRSGFVHISSVDIENYRGKLNTDRIKVVMEKVENPCAISISDQLIGSAVKDIISYDSVLHKEDTSSFLTVWLEHSGRMDKKVDPYFDPAMYTVFARNEVTGHISGYGTIVKCVKTTRIGPLYADSYEVCLKILEKLIQHRFEQDQGDANDRQHEFNVPSIQMDFKAFLVESGFQFIYKYHKCFTKEIVDLDYAKMFSLTLHVGVPE